MKRLLAALAFAATACSGAPPRPRATGDAPLAARPAREVPAPQPAPPPPQDDAPPTLLAGTPAGAATDGRLSEWARVAPFARFGAQGRLVTAWASVSRDEVRLALSLRGPAAERIRVTVELPGPAIPPPLSQATCVAHQTSLACGPSYEPCVSEAAARRACAPLVARSNQVRARMIGANRREYVLERGPEGWAVLSAGSAVAGASARAKPTPGGEVLEVDLPSDELPFTSEAPLRRAVLALALDAEPGAPSAWQREVALTGPVRMGAAPALLERWAGVRGALYRPGRTKALYLFREDVEGGLVQHALDVHGDTIHQSGALRLAHVHDPDLQHDARTDGLFLLDGDGLRWHREIAGTVVARGARGRSLVLVGLDLSRYGFHFHVFSRAVGSAYVFDPETEELEEHRLFEQYCDGRVGPRPTIDRLQVTLRCTSGGYDSDAPLVHLPPRVVSATWDVAKGRYVVRGAGD